MTANKWLRLRKGAELAAFRLAVVEAVEALEFCGRSRSAAIWAASSMFRVSTSAIWRWRARCAGIGADRRERLALLLPRWVFNELNTQGYFDGRWAEIARGRPALHARYKIEERLASLRRRYAEPA